MSTTCEGQGTNLLYSKARNKCAFSASTKHLYDHAVSSARASQQELQGATQKEKNHSQCFCSSYICALALSVP